MDEELLLTVGVVAARLGTAVHRVNYVVRTRAIRPSGRAGRSRVFTEAAVDQLRKELAKIDHGRDGAHE